MTSATTGNIRSSSKNARCQARRRSIRPASAESAIVHQRIAGGAWGYQHLLDILADPAHPERAEQIEWVGEEFDPDEFAVEIADAAIAARFRRK